MRHLAGLALLASASLALAAAYEGPGPVTGFPASYTDRSSARYELVATNGDQTVRRTKRMKFDDVLVFDDASTLHFAGDGTEPFTTAATWRPLSARIVEFTYTPETVAAAQSYITDQLGTAKPVRLRVGKGHLTFTRDGASYRGSQKMHATGRYRGVWFTVDVYARYRGTRQ